MRSDGKTPPQLVLVQDAPHPVYEVSDDTRLPYVPELLFDENLPSDMSLALRGSMFRFRTREERMQFAFGMQIANGVWP